jgi:hypothetical protein
MNNTTPLDQERNKSIKKQTSPGLRRTGYIASIIVMIVVIYVLRHLRDWGLTFLTEDFTKCLFYIELSIYISIAAQVIFLFYDPRWFKHFIQAITSVASAVALIMVYVIYPFAFNNTAWDKWIKIGLLVLFGLTIIGILVDLVKGIKYLAKDIEAA